MRKETIKKLGITLLLLLVVRLGSTITVPGINANIPSLGILETLNLLGGGSLERMSIFALGVGPYITAGIIIQLLSMDVIPSLTEWAKEGDIGRKKINKVTKYLAVVLAFIQVLSLSYGFDKQYGIMSNSNLSGYLFTATVMTAGTLLVLWLGNRITKYGIGNGLSLIIFSGIVSKIPSTLWQTWQILSANGLFDGLLKFGGYLLLYLTIIVLVIIVETATRKIPIQPTNAKAATANFLPFKLNNASVIPVIFAQAVLSAPLIIMSFVKYEWYEKLNNIFAINKPVGLVLYAILIIAFAFFYTHLQLDAKTISDNLKKGNMFIPGIRQGQETETYIRKVLNRLTAIGSVLLMLLAITPYILSMFVNVSTISAIGGTGIILIVGIALETIEQIEAENTQNSYRNFLKG